MERYETTKPGTEAHYREEHKRDAGVSEEQAGGDSIRIVTFERGRPVISADSPSLDLPATGRDDTTCYLSGAQTDGDETEALMGPYVGGHWRRIAIRRPGQG